MIHVGKISFHFKMADEQLAKGLYANWNEFCQSCFTKIFRGNVLVNMITKIRI